MSKPTLKRFFALLLAAAVVATAAAPAALAAEPQREQSEEGQEGWTLTLDEKKNVTLGTDSTLSVTVSGQPEGSTLGFAWSVTQGSDVLSLTGATNQQDVTLKPLRTGTATVSVTVTIGETKQTATCAVIVEYAAATGVDIDPKNPSAIDVNKTVSLTASVSPEYANQEAVTWRAENAENVGESFGDVVSLDRTSGGRVTVTGKKPGKAKVTATAGKGSGSDSVEITVSGLVIKYGGEPAETLELTVGSSGTLSTGKYGAAETAAPTWTSGNSGVVYVDTSGKITAQNVGSTIITAEAAGYTARCEVTVKENTASDINAGGVPSGQAFSLSQLRSDLNSRCRDSLGQPLSYVTSLSVDTRQGTLYYQYASADDPGYGVGSTEKYYYSPDVGQRGLADVSFVPSPDFSGTAKIRYSGCDSGNNSFSGTITFSVEESSNLSYSVRAGQSVAFQASDFNGVCKRNTGRDLRYVTFQLPSSSRGTLYYNYAGGDAYSERVQAGTQYGRTTNPYLDNVSFVPAEGYTGTFRISYTGVDTAGNSYTGRISVTVSDRSGTDAGDLTYTTARGRPVSFRAADFNTLCRDVLGETLDYVKFELPSSGQGTLYYNYSSSSNTGSRVSASTKYYRSGSPSISSVTFVPASGAESTVPIDFTAYDRDGYNFDGRVIVKLTGSGGDGEVRYSGTPGRAVEFLAADFNETCLDVNDETLRYVTFDLPSSSQGTLYYNYSSGSGAGSRVSASTKYYRSGSPSISNVSFVPKSGFTGTAYIDFSGYDVDGGRFDGTVAITIEAAETQELRYTVANTGALALDGAAFQSVCQSVTGRSLNYIRFQLPSSSRGTLYYQYDTDKDTYGSKVSASTSFYRSGARSLIDDVSFVPASGFTGTVTLSYTGWDTSGERFDGAVEVEVVSPVGSTIYYRGSSLPIAFRSNDFYDVCRSLMGRGLASVQFTSLPSSAAGVLYVDYQSPLNTGTRVSAGTYYSYAGTPGLGQISFVPKAGYQGTVTVPYRATDAAGKAFTGTVEIVLSNSYTASSFTDMGGTAWASPSVEFLRQYGIVAGYADQSYGPGQNIRRGDFVLMLCRAFDLSTASAPRYPDVPEDSYYAGAIAAATELGIVSGYRNGRFGPNDPLTRQDAMVMIVRTMQAVGRSLPAASASALSVFSDSGQVSDYAIPAAAALVQAGAVNGSGGRLNPRAAISRAEMAVILHRVLTL